MLFLAGKEANASTRPIFSLYRIDLDGKNLRPLAGSRLFTNPAAWVPNRTPV